MQIQRAVTVTDDMGGRTELRWIECGTWWTKPIDTPIVVDDTKATSIYQIEGPYRRDLLDLFHADGTGIRFVVNNLTLKVILFENPLLANRRLIAHCGHAVNAQ